MHFSGSLKDRRTCVVNKGTRDFAILGTPLGLEVRALHTQACWSSLRGQVPHLCSPGRAQHLVGILALKALRGNRIET